MPTKYIVAMLADNTNTFVEYAEQNFSWIYEEYILGHAALPHVTLVQFYAEEDDCLAIINFLKTVSERPQPRILGMQFGQDKTKQDILWAGLGVARDPDFINLQKKLVDFLASRNISAITETGDLYQPHITLARIKCDKINCQRFVISEVAFDLAIGIGGEFGQFKQVKHKFVPIAEANENISLFAANKCVIS